MSEREQIPMPNPSTSRIQIASLAASSTAAIALPSGAQRIEIRALDAVYIRFGAAGVGAAAADANSQLFPAGEKCQKVPDSTPGTVSTHVRVRSAANDCAVQIETVE